jgi:hypothetical protein
MLIGGARHARFRQSFDARLSIARLDFSRCGNPRRPPRLCHAPSPGFKTFE